MAINRRKKSANPVGRPPKKPRTSSVSHIKYENLSHKDRAKRMEDRVHTFTSKKLFTSIDFGSTHLREYYNESTDKTNNIGLDSVRRLDGDRLVRDFKILPLIKRKLNKDETFHAFERTTEYEREGVNFALGQGIGQSNRHRDTTVGCSRELSSRTFYFVLEGTVKFSIVLDTHTKMVNGELHDDDSTKVYSLKEGQGIIFPASLQHWADSKNTRKFLVFPFLVKVKIN